MDSFGSPPSFYLCTHMRGMRQLTFILVTDMKSFLGTRTVIERRHAHPHSYEKYPYPLPIFYPAGLASLGGGGRGACNNQMLLYLCPWVMFITVSSVRELIFLPGIVLYTKNCFNAKIVKNVMELFLYSQIKGRINQSLARVRKNAGKIQTKKRRTKRTVVSRREAATEAEGKEIVNPRQ